MTLIFATRHSSLAHEQTAHVIRRLQAALPGIQCREQVLSIRGARNTDRLRLENGDKDLFLIEAGKALLSSQVHAVVHSWKDLPLESVPGISIAAVPVRDSAFDALVSSDGRTLAGLPEAAWVGTSSSRRRAQLLARRPDLTIMPLVGSVDSRLHKLLSGAYDAIILAASDLTLLGMQSYITENLPLDVMLPAPGQGALAVMCREDDRETLELLSAINDPFTSASVAAERAFLAGLGGGCSSTIGAFAHCEDGRIILTGGVISDDGKQTVRLSAVDSDPQALGEQVARYVLERGGAELLFTNLHHSLQPKEVPHHNP